ncbi:MAG: 2-amino-4-hydroxy-6-hydroxymethyldihydropteridine diphosphokinase [Rhodospirillales bacterium]|nr:2-amino-4-hydroxy-6-hydroxymethyldihydropteridine diphosphokinase [Rhodospirillales bacterium]
MIIIGLGANLPSPAGPPRASCEAALDRLSQLGAGAVRVSRFYRSRPVPASDQPDFVNAVAELATEMTPKTLLQTLLTVERQFGRVRGAPNAARTLDLDLLDFDGLIRTGNDLRLPHPRMTLRAFVLLPLAEIAPEWRHPQSGRTAGQLLARLDSEQVVVPIE